MTVSKRKYLAFAAGAVTLSVVCSLAATLAADLYLHRRAERSAGLNRWGYRGPVVGRKQPAELRVVVLGGSTAFGYGVRWDEAIPALLERKLNESGGAPARVINLGFNNEGAFSFLPALQDFEYLDYDVVCLYEGYNDLIGDLAPNTAVLRHESAVFRLTGYFPILPLALREKALSLRYGGDLSAAYAASLNASPAPTVFRPNIAARTSATALEAAAVVSTSLGRQLARLSSEPPPATTAPGQAKCAPWSHYCEGIYAATRYALDRGKAVAIVAQPRKVDAGAQRHAEQQRVLAEMVARSFPANPLVRYVDLQGAVDLTNSGLAFDGMHLHPEGNAIIAAALVEPVRELAAIRERGSTP